MVKIRLLLESRGAHDRTALQKERLQQGRQKLPAFSPATGNVFVGLYASPNKFLHGNECDAFKKVKASTGPITVAFDNLPPGTYAVGAYHDENGNDHLDTNLVGLPVEGYALSNGVRAVLAPPRFTDAAFTVGGGDKPIALHIRY
jgi:uncharacterized protein (DUF2141 family)